MRVTYPVAQDCPACGPTVHTATVDDQEAVLTCPCGHQTTHSRRQRAQKLKLPRYIGLEDLARLEAALRPDEQAYALTRWLIDSGCRLSEALGLDTGPYAALHRGLYWKDIEDTGEASVSAVVTGKRGVERVVLFKRSTWNVLLALPEPHEGPVFSISRAAYRDRLRRYGVRPHQLRHSMITHLLNGGADIISAMDLAGHKRVDTMRIYWHIAGPRLHTLHRSIVLSLPRANRHLMAHPHHFFDEYPEQLDP